MTTDGVQESTELIDQIIQVCVWVSEHVRMHTQARVHVGVGVGVCVCIREREIEQPDLTPSQRTLY